MDALKPEPMPEGTVLFKNCPERIHRIVELPSRDLAVVTADDPSLRIYSLITGDLVHEIRNAHKSYAKDVAVLDENLFISVGGDFRARLWQISGWKEVDSVDLLDWGLSIASIGSNRFIVGTGMVGRILELHVQNNKLVISREIPLEHGWPDQIAVQAQDKQFAVTSTSGAITIWDSSTFQQIQYLDGHDQAAHCVCMSDKYLVTGADDRTLRVYSRDSWNCMKVVETGNSWPLCTQFIENGDFVLCASTRYLAIVDAAKGTPERIFDKMGLYTWVQPLSSNRIGIGMANHEGVAIFETDQLLYGLH